MNDLLQKLAEIAKHAERKQLEIPWLTLMIYIRPYGIKIKGLRFYYEEDGQLYERDFEVTWEEISSPKSEHLLISLIDRVIASLKALGDDSNATEVQD